MFFCNIFYKTRTMVMKFGTPTMSSSVRLLSVVCRL